MGYGTNGKVAESFLLRSDNGLAFTNCDYTRLAHAAVELGADVNWIRQ